MAGPIYHTGQLIHLDALLLSERIRHTPGLSAGSHSAAWEPTASDLDRITLPLAIERSGELWWYRASAVDLSDLKEPAARSRQFWTKKFDRDYLTSLDLGKATQVVTTLGRYKEMKVPVEAVYVPALVFYAVGDRDKVYRGLKRLRSVGKKASSGYGEVQKVEVELLADNPAAFVSDWRREDGRPSRNLPVVWAQEHGAIVTSQTVGPLRPPYWRKGDSVLIAR